MRKIIVLCSCIILSIVMCSCGCSHDWIEATCTAPKACSLCGETEGDVIPHEWIAATCTVPKTCFLCNETEGDVIPHEWIAATCTEPKTCFSCKTTEGNANGHSFVEATCTVPATCSVCNIENGEALGHTLVNTTRTKEPTCTETGISEGVCSTCNKTLTEEIPVLEHDPNDWIVTIEATYDNSGTEEKICNICNSSLEKREYSLTEEEKEIWFKEDCQKLAYAEYARYPEKYESTRIKVTGEVFLISDKNDEETGTKTYTYMISTKKEYGMYTGEFIYAIVENLSTRILENDVVTFYGELGGIDDILGIEYPVLNVIYYEIN